MGIIGKNTGVGIVPGGRFYMHTDIYVCGKEFERILNKGTYFIGRRRCRAILTHRFENCGLKLKREESGRPKKNAYYHMHGIITHKTRYHSFHHVAILYKEASALSFRCDNQTDCIFFPSNFISNFLVNFHQNSPSTLENPTLHCTNKKNDARKTK